MNTRSSRSRLAAAAVVLTAFLATPAAALAQAVITWGAATTIVGDTDVDTTGTLVWAYNFTDTGTPLTLNGVTFAAASANTADYTFSNTAALEVHPSVFGNPSSFFTSLSASYRVLLQSAIYFDSSATALTLNNLTAGQTYQFQLWSSDARSNSNILGRATTAADTSGNTITIAQNSATVGGSLGQHVTGTFTATGSTQQINLNRVPTSGAIVLNAASLRASPVPEPASAAALAGAFSLGLVALRRRRRRA